MFAPAEIAKRYSDAGAEKTRFTVSKTVILAVLAGIFIALGAFGSQVVSVDSGGSLGKFLGALIFPVGLLMVLMGGAELFTGNVLIFLSVLDQKASVKGMIRNWILVYLGNMAGGILVAMMLSYGHSYSLFDGQLAELVVSAAKAKVMLSFGDAFLRGILCNILVCIAVWVSFAASEAAGKILGLFLPVMLFVVSGYEHCVANMYFIPAGIFVSKVYGLEADIRWSDFFFRNLLPVTMGNIVGGAVIVSTAYYLAYLKKNDIRK
ncbi:MAG: formate/nitrite transporter family protein [Lachnospiraceae bacterium]|nr:formate/nitrite transporter family protein [Lachnospiraceae bacterium]